MIIFIVVFLRKNNFEVKKLNDIKMIIVDLDQTLLKNDKSVSPFSIDVLNRCKDKKIMIGIATARSERGSKLYIDKIKPDLIISNGGARATYCGNTVYDCLLSTKTSDMLIKTCLENKDVGEITVETKKAYYSNNKSTYYIDAIYWDFNTPLSMPTYKITVQIFDKNSAKNIASNFPECNFLNFTGELWHRFSHKDATKSKALFHASQHLKIDMKNIAAFGDDTIDIDMVKHCGIGIAMGNGVDKIKDIASFICDTNENDGVAKWLESNILNPSL